MISDGYVVKTSSVLGHDLTFPTEQDAKYVATAMNKLTKELTAYATDLISRQRDMTPEEAELLRRAFWEEPDE